MDKLIYLVYPALLAVAFFGSKWYGRKKWNEEAFSLQQMKAIQAFSAICIMFHHIGQKTCASWHPAWTRVPGLELFVPIGYFFVGIFLFCSGYGLLVSYRSKENYLQGFFKRRVLPLILAYYLSGAVYLSVRFLMGEKMSPWQLFCYISGIKLCNVNAWYVIALPIFYAGFYFAFKYCKSEGKAIFCTALVVFLYTLLGTFVDHNDYWMRGEWWYNSVHMFTVGLLFARYEEKIVAHLKKRYVIDVIAAFVLMLLLYSCSEIAQNVWGYYGDNWNDPLKVPHRWGCLITQMGASFAFVAFVFLLGMKVRFGNRVLTFMSTMTLEFYLIHGIYVELFGYDFLELVPSLYYIRNNFLHVCVVIALGVPSAWLFKKMLDFILKRGSSSATKA